MAAADCYDLMMEGPDIHCPRCQIPMVAWNWGGQILYTCNGCNALGFNIERAGVDIDRFKVLEVLDGHECKGCSKSVERREAPNVDFYTCSGCNVGLFADVKEIQKLDIDFDDTENCANHREIRLRVGEAYDRLVKNLM